MSYLLVALALTSLGSGLLAWYLRSKARRAEERALAAESAMSALRSVNTELRAALDRVVQDTAARNKRDERQDAKTVESIESGDADAVAEMLRQLHQDGPGPGPR